MESKAKILVVDDELGIRDWLSFELKQQGYMVLTAANGNEGLDKVKQDKFDIAIIDIMMPGMDGITLLGHIRQIDPNVRAIMATGYGTPETKTDCVRKGAFDYLNKPFNVEEILLLIEKALTRQ